MTVRFHGLRRDQETARPGWRPSRGPKTSPSVTTHAGVWGATNDDGIRLMHDHGFATPETIYVHAATLDTDSYQRIAASGGSISVSTESEQSAGQGYPPTWQVRHHDIPVSLSMDTSVWWSGDLFSAMRSTLGADRSREHMEAPPGDTVTHHTCRGAFVEGTWRRRRTRPRRIVVWKRSQGRRRLLKTTLTVSFPLLNPYGPSRSRPETRPHRCNGVS